ncbi:MAG: hypothetical protein ACYCXW_16295 [Solirubrobacteraceae bacterium]
MHRAAVHRRPETALAEVVGSRWPPTVNAVEQSPLRRRIDWSPDAV